MLPQIESFMESITGFSIYDNILDIQVLYFRYQIVKLFTKDKWTVSEYLVNL